MDGHEPKRNAGWRMAARFSAFSTVVLAAGVAVAPGCLSRPIERVDPRTTTTIVERLIQSAVDKIDLVLDIDNSRSMADKQEILALAVPDLVNALVNPKCINTDGTVAAHQPASPTEECPDAGSEREFKPVLNIHIGVITSSIGDHGGDACPESTPNTFNNDMAHLISRKISDPFNPANPVPTYNSLGFLWWGPDIPGAETNVTALVSGVKDLVAGAGEVGCGFEAPLEAWYRFLVDPNPWESVEEQDGKAVVSGTDQVLLDQRKNFMRPDSLLAIIMLTDETDCSIRDGGQYFYAAKG